MLMTTQEVATRLGCSADNVRILERKGKLPAEKTQTGVRIFKSEDVDRFAAERSQKKAAKNKGHIQ